MIRVTCRGRQRCASPNLACAYLARIQRERVGCKSAARFFRHSHACDLNLAGDVHALCALLSRITIAALTFQIYNSLTPARYAGYPTLSRRLPSDLDKRQVCKILLHKIFQCKALITYQLLLIMLFERVKLANIFI